MHPRFVSALGYATIVAAATVAAVATTQARAESPTIDNTPFVSMRTRADVRAELMAPHAALGYAEWTGQGNDMRAGAGGYTRAEAIAAYRDSRDEAKALSGEDSGSMYLAQRSSALRRNTMLARAAR
jgi:hypothetical protein